MEDGSESSDKGDDEIENDIEGKMSNDASYSSPLGSDNNLRDISLELAKRGWHSLTLKTLKRVSPSKKIQISRSIDDLLSKAVLDKMYKCVIEIPLSKRLLTRSC